jgi:hypothetical protein
LDHLLQGLISNGPGAKVPHRKIDLAKARVERGDKVVGFVIANGVETLKKFSHDNFWRAPGAIWRGVEHPDHTDLGVPNFGAIRGATSCSLRNLEAWDVTDSRFDARVCNDAKGVTGQQPNPRFKMVESASIKDQALRLDFGL